MLPDSFSPHAELGLRAKFPGSVRRSLRLRLAFGHDARGPMRRKNGNGRMYFEHRNMDGYDRDAGPLRKQSLAQSAWLGLIFTNQKIIRL